MEIKNMLPEFFYEYYDFYKVLENCKFGIYTKSFHKIINIEYIEITFVESIETFFCRIKKNGTTIYECRDKDGKLTNILNYRKIWFDHFNNENLFLVTNDLDGDYLDDHLFDNIGIKLGVINEKFEIIIPMQYDDIIFYNNRFALMKSEILDRYNIHESDFGEIDSHYSINGGKWGVTDYYHNIIIPFEYNYISFTKDPDKIIVNIGSKMFYLKHTRDKHGYVWHEGGKWGVIDSKNNIKVPINYSTRTDYHDTKIKIILHNGNKMKDVNFEEPHEIFEL